MFRWARRHCAGSVWEVGSAKRSQMQLQPTSLPAKCRVLNTWHTPRRSVSMISKGFYRATLYTSPLVFLWMKAIQIMLQCLHTCFCENTHGGVASKGDRRISGCQHSRTVSMVRQGPSCCYKVSKICDGRRCSKQEWHWRRDSSAVVG